MMATYKDGRFSCSVHGDLGSESEAIKSHTVLYGGDGGGTDGYLCMSCLGEASQEPLEPTLVKCPFCSGSHPKFMVDLCPLNPYKQR